MTSRLPLEEWLDEDYYQPTTYKETMEVHEKERRCKPKPLEESFSQSYRPFNYKNYVAELNRTGGLRRHFSNQRKSSDENRFDETYLQTSRNKNGETATGFSEGCSGDLKKNRHFNRNGISTNILKPRSNESDQGNTNVGKKPNKCRCGICDTSVNLKNELDVYFRPYHSEYKKINQPTNEANSQTGNRHDQHLHEKQNCKTVKHNNVENHHHLSTNKRDQQTTNGLNKYLTNLNESSRITPQEKEKKNRAIKTADECGNTVEKPSHKKKAVSKSLPRRRCYCDHCEETHKYRQSSKDSSHTDQEHLVEESLQSRAVDDETISNQGTVGSTDDSAMQQDTSESSTSDNSSECFDDEQSISRGMRHICNQMLRETRKTNSLLLCLLFAMTISIGSYFIGYIAANSCRSPPPRSSHYASLRWF